MASHDELTGYKIWAVDNVVYGPVELPTLVTWVKEERVSDNTWVYRESDDTWQKAAELEELRMFFRQRSPSASGGTKIIVKPSSVSSLHPGILRRVKIFAGMTDHQLSRFLKYMEIQGVPQWCEVVKQGDPGDAMYLILEGEVRVRIMIAGKESILVTLPAGEFFGEISLFDHGPRSADVIANVDSLLLKISAASFQKLAVEAPDLSSPFLLAMGRTLTGRIRADNKRFRDSISLARATH